MSDSELNIESTSNDIGADLFGPSEDLSTPVDEINLETPALEVETEVPEVKAEETEAPPAEIQEEETPAPVGAPKTWRKEALAAWESLPQVVKDEVAKREEDMFKGIETYKQGAAIGDNFGRCVSPHLDHLQRAGVNVYEEISGLLDYGRIMRFGTMGEKMGLLSTIAQEYGVDLLDLAEAAPAQPYVDPAIKALQDEINALKSGRQQESSQAELRTRQEAQSKIDTFAADPKHSLFKEVESEMAIFVAADPNRDLEKAYEKAVWANPLTRAKEQTRLATEAKAQSEKKVKEAKAALDVNLKTNARPGSATAPTGSMDDTMRQQLAEIRSRT